MTTAIEHSIEHGTALPVMESFYTIQGEGEHSGRAAYFIRLGGCDVGCHWCDVKDSWDASRWPVTMVDKIARKAAAFPSDIVVVTGGEPLMYDLRILTATLHDYNLNVHIETSGAHPLSGQIDWICFSPKKFKAPREEFYHVADELKVVILNKHDLQWAEGHAQKVNKNCSLLLQPEWERRNEVMPLIIDYVKKNPKWKVCLQAHKYLDVP